MGHGHQWFYMMRQKQFYKPVIEFKPLLVGSFLVSLRKNAAPCYGKTITFKSHLCKKFHVLFHMMVVINRYMAWIINPVFDLFCHISGVTSAKTVIIAFSGQHYISSRQTFPVLCISSLTLIGGSSAAP